MDFFSDPAPRDRARDLAEREVAPSVASRDREARWDRAPLSRLGDAGLLGAFLPPADGGSGLSAEAFGEALAGFGEGSLDAGLAAAWAAHAFGCVVPLSRLGTPAQRARWLPALARGEALGTIAHREHLPAAAPTGVRTQAIRRAGGWTLRGTKTWVVSGPAADVLVVTAVTDPSRGKDGVSAFLVPKDAPGLAIASRTETLGLRTAVIADLALDDCALSADAILGAEGTGLTAVLRLAQRWERALLFAPWIGFMKVLVDQSVVEAKERFVYGRPAARSQSVRATLADMRIRLELSRRMQARAAWQLGREGADGDREIATSALYLAESVAFVTRGALTIHGLHGAEADRLPARLFRDAAVVASLSGAGDVLRPAIAGALLHLG